MKRYIYIVLVTLFIAGITGCDETWNEHYITQSETVDQNVWEAIKGNADVSKFVELVEKFELDSLFDDKYNDVYTLFVPTNEAINNYVGEVTMEGVAYHILHYYIQPNTISGKRKIQTLLLKFAQFENANQELFYDGIPVVERSPLFQNGRYFTISAVATPKPSLYEYIAENNPALKRFIDEQDSIILDKEASKPLGFDNEGNTIYDSVITVINLFEEEYFEVSEEFRLKTATLVFPRKELYEAALTKMALNIGSGYTSYLDIAEEWQQDVLIPRLLERGVFENQRELFEFQRDTLKNILGNDVIIDYRPVDKTLCSNGYAYDYAEFEILDSLYLSPLKTEGESLLKTLGKDRFTWNEDVKVNSSETFVPNGDNVTTASNDSILKVTFPNKFDGQFVLEFKTEPLFPRRYLFVIRTHMDYGGIYDIYVNDELVKTFDWYDFTRYRGIINSQVSGVRYIAEGRYNMFDFWVDNITEYGAATVRFEYKGPGQVRYNGLVLDYLECNTEAMLDNIDKHPSDY